MAAILIKGKVTMKAENVNDNNLLDMVNNLFLETPFFVMGVFVRADKAKMADQCHTNEAFSEKWRVREQGYTDTNNVCKQFQLDWYLKLYGYSSEVELMQELQGCKVILDAGCGLGYKAAWFAKLAPESLIIAMDFSEAIFQAANHYQNFSNIIFVKGDIADTGFRDGIIDLISCDQVLHHTESPPRTLLEFFRISSKFGKLNTYVYAKKALPRELLDEYFRTASQNMTHEQIWEMSRQLTELGKRLSEFQIIFDVPDIPALGIKGGPQDLQRFFYWNFIKCFWNEELGFDSSVGTNFDWYAPSIAFRYDKKEFLDMCQQTNWHNEFLHSEEACWSGRFTNSFHER